MHPTPVSLDTDSGSSRWTGIRRLGISRPTPTRRYRPPLRRPALCTRDLRRGRNRTIHTWLVCWRVPVTIEREAGKNLWLWHCMTRSRLGDTDRFTALELAQNVQMGKNKRVPISTTHTGTTTLCPHGYTPPIRSPSSHERRPVGLRHAHLYSRVSRRRCSRTSGDHGQAYVEKMVYYLTGNGGEELVRGRPGPAHQYG